MSQLPEIVSGAFQSLLEEKQLSLANDNDVLYDGFNVKSESYDDELCGNADDEDELFGKEDEDSDEHDIRSTYGYEKRSLLDIDENDITVVLNESVVL